MICACSLGELVAANLKEASAISVFLMQRYDETWPDSARQQSIIDAHFALAQSQVSTEDALARMDSSALCDKEARVFVASVC